MRKITEMQLKMGQVPISDIEIDLHSRDEIPQLLLGLRAIDSNRKLRDGVFQREAIPGMPKEQKNAATHFFTMSSNMK
jgi:hypothetical protein